MVVFGAHFSALWILMANSWMQTPQGYEVVNNRAVMTDFWQVVFTPTFIPRLLHVWAASWTVGAALMCSVSAWYLLKKQHIELAKSNLKAALPVFILFAILNVVVFGANMAIAVTNNQPLKLASMEGLFQSESCARMFVVGWVDTATQTTSGISIPCLLSFLAYQDIHATVQGIDSFAPDPDPADQSPVPGLSLHDHDGACAGRDRSAGGDHVPVEAAALRVPLRPVAAGPDRVHRRGDDHRRMVDG